MNVLLTTLALSGAAQMTPPLQGTTWTLTSIDPRGYGEFRLGSQLSKPTLQLRGTTLTGSTGCSPLKATASVKGQAINIRHLNAGNSNRCTDHALSLREDYTRLLARTTRYDLQGTTLTLYAGKGRLIFSAQPTMTSSNTPDLNGPWTPTSLTRNGQPVTIPGSAALTFTQTAEQLQLSGSMGCNRLNASGPLNGKQVTFGGMVSTRMMCPPEQMQAEYALGEVLRQPLQVQQIGNTLTLRNSQGQLTLTRPAQATALKGAYTLVSINGQPVTSTARPVTVEFQGDHLNGSDGCNSYGAPYQLTGDQVQLTGPAFSTLMACLDGQEVPITQLLERQPTYTLNGPLLTLRAGPDTWVFQAR